MSSLKSAAPVYSAEQVSDLMKLRVAKKDLQAFNVPPPPKRGLSVWHPGLSLMEQAGLPVKKRELLWIVPHLQTKDFAVAPVQAAYYSVCLPAPGTERLDATRQDAVVAPFGETACPVAIASWTWLVHFVATGKSLGRGFWMRCRETPSLGRRVVLSAADRLRVRVHWEDDASDRIRLASLGTSKEGNLVS